ncbi:serine/threonine-protein phosphatase 6 regulatory ankyrin repeat subunit C-like [Schistocerca nitens]|uniref:serine/threonine-protein phosphatase 6 regulatory ankyrin repeat subunit C-like n=1 Tax=Schistocerca nitens TaxID=7011 RepID=UPI002118254F|nr:serine/threonine-protein phosphatase 6 regulatory ankyrin repeat subunit C-like [Schistocerca nitens]
MVKWCLKQGANIDCHYEDMLTPLHIAAEKGHEEMLDILLKHSNKCIDSKTLFGDTALLIATQNEHKLIMKKLLDKGANVNCTDIFGRTPLHVAVFKKKSGIVKILLSYGARVNTMDTFGEHALCTAVITSPNPPVTYALLKNEANINCINSQGMSLLSEAILSANTKSSIDAIKMLLRRGASVNMRNTINGQTPLHVAAQTGNQPIVEFLVASGADTKVKDHHGQTVLNEILDEDSDSGSESEYKDGVMEYDSDRESDLDVREDEDSAASGSHHEDVIVALSGRRYVTTQSRTPRRSVANMVREQAGVTPAGVCHSPGEALKLLLMPDIMDVIVKHSNEEAVRQNVTLTYEK